MTDILAVLARFFGRRGIRCRLNKAEGTLLFRMRGTNGSWRCRITVDSRTGLLLFRCVYPVRAPCRYLHEVAILLAAMNHDQPIACFGIDWRARTISCRTSISLDACGSRAILEDVVFSNILATDVHLPIIREVLHGRMTARRGIAEARALRGQR